jgi:hypothetical protein
MNRRDFLGAASAAGYLAATANAQEQPRPPRVGLIGCGGTENVTFCDSFKSLRLK